MNITTIRRPLLAFGLGLSMVLGATAAGAASASTDAPDVVHPHLDDANVDEAAVGITLFVLDNSANAGGTITAPCPLMTTDQYGYFMGQQGLTPNLAGWFVDVVYYTDVGMGAPGVNCGIDVDAHLDQIGAGPPHGGNIEAMSSPSIRRSTTCSPSSSGRPCSAPAPPTSGASSVVSATPATARSASSCGTALLSMYDITGVATFAQVLGERPGVTLLQSDIPTIGGEIYGGDCALPPADLSMGAFCVRIWHREGLIVMIEVGGTGQAGMGTGLTDVLFALIPQVVDDLATNASWPVPAAAG